MPLRAGARIGPYEITGALGAGGMGEVYRAKDTTLNRDVAIKVLPEAFAQDADRLARFTREAQVLASLNHPNIAAIYGIENARPGDGTGRGRGLVAAYRTRRAPSRRSPPHRASNRRSARSRAQRGHHSPRSQTREHQGPRRRHGEGARFRSRQSTRAGRRECDGGCDELPDTHDSRDDSGRNDPRHGGVHGAGAGERQAG